MPNTYLIADWHYGHENIISYDNRPFKTVDEMNTELIKRWNDKVRKGDEVDDRRLVLCHYPIPFFKNHTRDGWSHLYGHVHVSFEYNMTERMRREIVDLYQKPCRMYNVGAMMPWMDYTPRTFDEIVEGYEHYQESISQS